MFIDSGSQTKGVSYKGITSFETLAASVIVFGSPFLINGPQQSVSGDITSP